MSAMSAVWAKLVLGLLAITLWPGYAQAQELPEYRLKAAFLYNFAQFTEWPADTPSSLTLCVVGNDPFDKDLDSLAGRPVGQRLLAVKRRTGSEPLVGCQVVYIAPSLAAELPRLLATLKNKPVLTVADSPGAMRQGVALNMTVSNGRVNFEANLLAARAAGLNLSSRLLRLATEVVQ
jgi:YfiR/HmsC-like